MNDTPRTDEMRQAYVNFQHGKYTVDVGDVFDFARKLERELNEARKIAAELRDLVPWSESEPWNFSWENVDVLAPAGEKTPTKP